MSQLEQALALLREKVRKPHPCSGRGVCWACTVEAFLRSVDAPGALSPEQVVELRKEGEELCKEIEKRTRPMTRGPFPTGGGR